MLKRLIAIAPMMDYTDRHCRYFFRLLTKQALLYTEMITTQALLRGDYQHLLQYNPEEHPVALQLGGSDPKALAACAKMAEEFGYDEVNLNVGCPSDRVQGGQFGACLMKQPQLVAEGVAAMIAAVKIPVTVKMRLGVDEYDSEAHLHEFVEIVKQAGCEIFILHARKAWLKGLSPKQNRQIPPLQYERVYHLKKTFPQLTIMLNGGVENLTQAKQHLLHVDGVMLGRAAYQNPYLLAEVDQQFYQDAVATIHEFSLPSRKAIVEKMQIYIDEQRQQGVRIGQITRHLLGLMHGMPGAKQWKQALTDLAQRGSGKISDLL